MPTDNISATTLSQTESLLSPITSKDSESSGSSFEQTLAKEVQNNDSSDAKTSSISTEKPCIAQFMVMTGCDFSTASKALYQYGNWEDYINSSSTIPDLSSAQNQLANEVSSGDRPEKDGIYGQRSDFVKPEPFVTDTPGKVVPVFDKLEKLSGLGVVTSSGEQKTVLNITDKNSILEATDGFHIGRQALDSFSQEVTGNSSSTFSQLNLEDVAKNFMSKSDWKSKFGESNIWQDPEETDTNSEQETLLKSGNSLLASIASPISSSSYASILNDASNIS